MTIRDKKKYWTRAAESKIRKTHQTRLEKLRGYLGKLNLRDLMNTWSRRSKIIKK